MKEILQTGLSCVFAISAISKIRDIQVFEKSVYHFRVPLRYIKYIAKFIIVMEATVAIFSITAIVAKIGLILALLLLTLFSFLIIKSLWRGDHFPCACFGERSSNPISWWHIVRNALLISVTLYLLLLTDAQNYMPGNQTNLFLYVIFITSAWFGYRSISKRFNSDVANTIQKTSGSPGASQKAQLINPSVPDDLGFKIESFLSEGKPVILLFLDFQFLSCKRLLASIDKQLRNLSDMYTIRIAIKNQSDDSKKITGELNKEMVIQYDHELAASFELHGVPALAVLDKAGAVSGRVIGEKAIYAVLSTSISQLTYPQKKTSCNNPVNYLLPASLDAMELVNKNVQLILLNNPGYKQTLLIFWSPYCQACAGLLEEMGILKALQARS